MHMAFPYNAAVTNQALSKLGSSYMVPQEDEALGGPAMSAPVQAPAPAGQPSPTIAQDKTFMTAAAPAAPAPVAQATDTEKAPGLTAGSGEKTPMMDQAGKIAQSVTDAENEKAADKTKALGKVAGVIGAITNAYTGNYGGMVNNVSGVIGGK